MDQQRPKPTNKPNITKPTKSTSNQTEPNRTKPAYRSKLNLHTEPKPSTSIQYNPTIQKTKKYQKHQANHPKKRKIYINISYKQTKKTKIALRVSEGLGLSFGLLLRAFSSSPSKPLRSHSSNSGAKNAELCVSWREEELENVR